MTQSLLVRSRRTLSTSSQTSRNPNAMTGSGSSYTVSRSMSSSVTHSTYWNFHKNRSIASLNRSGKTSSSRSQTTLLKSTLKSPRCRPRTSYIAYIATYVLDSPLTRFRGTDQVRRYASATTRLHTRPGLVPASPAAVVRACSRIVRSRLHYQRQTQANPSFRPCVCFCIPCHIR